MDGCKQHCPDCITEENDHCCWCGHSLIEQQNRSE